MQRGPEQRELAVLQCIVLLCLLLFFYPSRPPSVSLSVGELKSQEGKRGQKPALLQSSQIAPEPVSSAVGRVFERVSTLWKPAVEFQTPEQVEGSAG